MLISPQPGNPILAQVVFGHPASGNASTFLEEARELAQFGVRSSLVSFPFASPHAGSSGNDPANLKNPDREIEFRKKCMWEVEKAALSLSMEIPITYVGKNFGAFIGGLAASHENKITRFVLIAGLPDLTDFYVSSDHTVALKARGNVSEEELEFYRERTHYWNPAQRLPRSKRLKQTEIFFQFGKMDSWIPEEVAHHYIRSAPSQKEYKFYNDGHDLTHLQAKLDRRKFILQTFFKKHVFSTNVLPSTRHSTTSDSPTK